jgi:hypothetical protein
MRCDSCEASVVTYGKTTAFVHEHGCRRTNARFDADSDSWIPQRVCFDCGCTVDSEDLCCAAIDEEESEAE